MQDHPNSNVRRAFNKASGVLEELQKLAERKDSKFTFTVEESKTLSAMPGQPIDGIVIATNIPAAPDKESKMGADADVVRIHVSPSGRMTVYGDGKKESLGAGGFWRTNRQFTTKGGPALKAVTAFISQQAAKHKLIP